ncbi:hypothetical protein A2U01_0102281, partial [Trifolium medium]|nr:hypothetical protein [Trifolium medium]
RRIAFRSVGGSAAIEMVAVVLGFAGEGDCSR